MNNPIPTYGMCSFLKGLGPPDEAVVRSLDHPSDELYVRRIAPYSNEYPNITLPHKHNFYHFMYFTKGKGSQTIDFVTFDIEPGSIHFMIPGQVHTFTVEDETNLYLVNFSETYFRSFLRTPFYIEQFPFFSGHASDGVVCLGKELQPKVKNLLDNVLEESSRHNGFSPDLIKVWMLELLMLIANQCEKDCLKRSTSKQHSLTLHFKKLLEENYLKRSLPKEYAALLSVTTKYLNDLCRKELGKTTGEVIRDRKLLEAKRFLANADMNVSEIAYELNFSDHSHFTKFFRKHTGQSPEEFRRSLLNRQ